MDPIQSNQTQDISPRVPDPNVKRPGRQVPDARPADAEANARLSPALELAGIFGRAAPARQQDVRLGHPPVSDTAFGSDRRGDVTETTSERSQLLGLLSLASERFDRSAQAAAESPFAAASGEAVQAARNLPQNASGGQVPVPQGHERHLATFTDGKLGSIETQFGRIRTTHHDGPGIIDQPTENFARFKVNFDQAAVELRRDHPLIAFKVNVEVSRAKVELQKNPGDRARQEELEQADTRQYFVRKRWMANVLLKSIRDELPTQNWAQRIDNVRSLSVLDPSQTAGDQRHLDDPNSKFMEVWSEGDDLIGSHVSRGSPIAIDLTSSEILHFLAASKLAKEEATIEGANTAFYNHITSHVPRLASLIWRPDEV